ncbi:hypothetical protein ACLGGT_21550 [Roseovarius sp. MS2]|uniref:hypothetical protein n=1 Tax=Roseovarius sp. MS2 TaxID=3390728 RepID=UPI003EDBB51E
MSCSARRGLACGELVFGSDVEQGDGALRQTFGQIGAVIGSGAGASPEALEKYP